MKRQPTSWRFDHLRTNRDHVRAVKNLSARVTIQGLSPAEWVHAVLETSEGNHLVEEMKKKYRLAI